MAETRLRITEAAVELHGTIGPARTTLSAVAERAGVQRHTVYRHFPTEADLFAACSGHYFTANPWPDPEPWRTISDPQQRLATHWTICTPTTSAPSRCSATSCATPSSSRRSGRRSCRCPPTWPKRPRSWRPAGAPAAEGGACWRPRCPRDRLPDLALAHSSGTITRTEAVELITALVDAAAAPRQHPLRLTRRRRLTSNAAFPNGQGPDMAEWPHSNRSDV